MVVIDSTPWFVAADICKALSLTQPTNSIRALDDNEKVFILKSNLNLNTIPFPNRGAQLISESGLYKLIMRSDKPQAKPFQDWVTKVVLPAIRKDGGYIAGEENTDDDDLLMARALQVAQRKIESILCKSISYQLPRSLGQTHETVRFY